MKFYRLFEIALKNKKINKAIQIKLHHIFIGKETDEKGYDISVYSRITSLNRNIVVKVDEEKYECVEGYIFTAKLKDIVSVYDVVGHKLFEKNVRYNIQKDYTGVSDEIKETLKVYPDQFWFLNNGITIITNKPVDLKRHSCITLENGNGSSFSVVNGAQTISACHEVFFCEDISEDIKKMADSAEVVLRVVSVVAKNIPEEIEENNREQIEELLFGKKETVHSMVERISVSLNSQKPIEAQDLAYHSTFVKGINKLFEQKTNDERAFRIARRGETGNKYNLHELPTIARAICASGFEENGEYVYKPWISVNMYNAKVLETNNMELVMQEFFDSSCVQGEKFYRKYQNINMAVYLHRVFSNIRSTYDSDVIKKTPGLDELKRRGGWYFVSFVFELLLDNKNNEKILSERCISELYKIIRGDFKEMLDLFFDIYGESIKTKGQGYFPMRSESGYASAMDRTNLKKYQDRIEHIREKLVYIFSQDTIYTLDYPDTDVRVVEKGGRVVLLKGSKIAIDVKDSCPQKTLLLREKYKEIINDDGIIMADIVLETKTVAASFIQASKVRGEKRWKIITDIDNVVDAVEAN